MLFYNLRYKRYIVFISMKKRSYFIICVSKNNIYRLCYYFISMCIYMYVYIVINFLNGFLINVVIVVYINNLVFF